MHNKLQNRIRAILREILSSRDVLALTATKLRNVELDEKFCCYDCDNNREESIMKTSTITEAKNNVSQLIHHLETGEAALPGCVLFTSMKERNADRVVGYGTIPAL